MKNKTLIAFSSYNAPWFLEHLVSSFERTDPGADCDLLIIDNSSIDAKQLALLDKFAKKYRVESKPNYGRAQHAYDYAWQNNKDYKYYFFMHDDSSFLRDGWLKLAVNRIEDESCEDVLPTSVRNLPVGKVGFQSYEWQNKRRYLRTGYSALFDYIEPVAKILNIEMPEYHQHISDDRYLIKNELLQKMGHVWNIETFKQMEIQGDPTWKDIDEWFVNGGLENYDPFSPERYTYLYHKFQTVTEFLSDIAPMRYGYRTHHIDGDGDCQEETGWSKFSGVQYIAHYGSHSLFKRLSLLLGAPEEDVRSKFKDKTFLQIADNFVKKERNKING